MAEMQIDFSGKRGWVALGIVGLVLVVRIATLGSTDDPKPGEAIRAELQNDLGGRLGTALAALPDGAATTDIIDMADADNIRIYDTSVSKPLLSFGSSAKTIVKLEYKLPGGERTSDYWRFEHSLIGGWHYRRRSQAWSYYLNFL